MSPVLGHIIVIAMLAVPVFFAGRYCFREIKGALTDGSCGGCSGGCSGDCSSCGSSCSCGGNEGISSSSGTIHAAGADQHKTPAGPKRYAINGKIVVIPENKNV